MLAQSFSPCLHTCYLSNISAYLGSRLTGRGGGVEGELSEPISDFLGRGGGGTLAVSSSTRMSGGGGTARGFLTGPTLGLLYTELELLEPMILDTVLALTGRLGSLGVEGSGRLAIESGVTGDGSSGI